MSLNKVVAIGTNQVIGSLQKPIQQAAQQVAEAIDTPKCLEGLSALGSYNKNLVKQSNPIKSTTAKFYNEVMSDETFNRAKNMVMESILDTAPKESLVLVQNDKISKPILGEFHRIDTTKVRDILEDPKNKIIAIHSHPDLKAGIGTGPVSFSDFAVLNSCLGCKSIFAINSKGEYSTLKKIGRQLSIDEVNKLYAAYIKKTDFIANGMNLNFASPNLREYLILEKQWEEALEKTDKPPQILIEKIGQIASQLTNKDWDEYLNNYYKTAIDYVHQFWTDNATKANVKYYTNFSNLKG